MRDTRILLTTLNAKYIHMNLAIRLLYGLNRQHGGLSFREFAIKEKPEEIAKACMDFEVVAFSCYIWNITQTLEVAKQIKALRPEVKIMLGGPEVSYDWYEIAILPHVDYIIVGEGEIPFAQFLQQYPNCGDIGNLVHKDENGAIQFMPQGGNFDIQELANLNPYEFEPAEELKNKVAYIETSRGCPYKCEFCLASLDNKVRYLPMQRIKENLLYLMQHGKVIKFLDRTFNVKKDFTLEIFQFILDNHKPGNVFQFEITADIVHPDIIAFIKAKVPKGLFRFEIGIQTVNQKANLEVSRKQNFEKTKGVILQLRDYIDMHLDLIVGLPLDYMSDIAYSFEQVFALHPPELQLGFLKFLKGTPVREKYEQYGFRFDPNPPYQIIESNYLSKEELHSITLLEEALELYWNKGRATHSLKYVQGKASIFNFFMELGKWFNTRYNFHQHSLLDSFVALHSFAEVHDANDLILKELIALDYYLHFKVKPQQQFLFEPEKAIRQQVIEKLQANHHKYRHVVLPVSFHFQHYINKQEILLEPKFLCLQYDGISKAIVLGSVNKEALALSEEVSPS